MPWYKKGVSDVFGKTKSKNNIDPYLFSFWLNAKFLNIFPQ